MQAGFRRYLAHGRSPTQHRLQWNAVRGRMQDDPGNNDADALPDSPESLKFSHGRLRENFIRSDLKGF
jgi:hypothetical protein